MAAEVLQGVLGGDDAGEKLEYPRSARNVVIAGGLRYEFPDDYSFRAEGTSLVVLNGSGEVAVVLAQGSFSLALARGAHLAYVEKADEPNIW